MMEIGNDEKRRGKYLGIWNGIHFELAELLITGRKPPLCNLFILKMLALRIWIFNQDFGS